MRVRERIKENHEPVETVEESLDYFLNVIGFFD
jgi:hypothetical protein